MAQRESQIIGATEEHAAIQGKILRFLAGASISPSNTPVPEANSRLSNR